MPAVLAAACLLLSLSGAMAEQTAPRADRNAQPPSVIDPDLDPCRYFDAPGEPMVGFFIDMDLEGTRVPMRVPERYVRRAATVGEGAVTTTLLVDPFEVHTFEPLPQGELARRNREGLPWDWMHFTVTDVLPLETLTNMRLRRPITPEDIGKPRDPPDWRDYPIKRAKHGLKRLVAPDIIGTSVVSQHPDVFLDFDSSNEVATLIGCKRVGPGPVPGYTNTASCEHHFRTAGVDARASYLRTELPNWSRIQSNITRFLTCATSNAL